MPTPFVETRINDGLIVYGTVGGPEYNTSVTVVSSGHESRNANWAEARGRWELGERMVTSTELEQIIAFFRARKGMAVGFRFRDHADYRVPDARGTGVLGAGVGNGMPSYQLNKRYTDAAQTDVRAIRKPVAGSVTILRNGSPVTTGTGPGQYALDTTTGIVTFVPDTQASVTAVTVGSVTEVTLSGVLPGLTSSHGSNMLYLIGLGGPDAGLLNGKTHRIVGISSTTYRINTDTLGKAITAGGGAARRYPQGNDALTWVGEFDVPVRFDTDSLRSRFEALDKSTGQALHYLFSLPLIEVRV